MRRSSTRSERILSVVLAAAVLVGGCASWHLTPYDGRPFCDLAGGIYTAGGRCLAGNL